MLEARHQKGKPRVVTKPLVFCAVSVLAACGAQDGTRSSVESNSQAKISRSPIIDPTGWPIFDQAARQVGLVTSRRGAGAVVVHVQLRNVPPGVHGIHIHEYPKCEPPTFGTAGAHWNWTSKQHGHKNPQGYHVGDLGNIMVGSDGVAEKSFSIPAKDWEPNLKNGLSVVIHSHPDDDRTDPSGKSGERIACGLLFLRAD